MSSKYTFLVLVICCHLALSVSLGEGQSCSVNNGTAACIGSYEVCDPLDGLCKCLLDAKEVNGTCVLDTTTQEPSTTDPPLPKPQKFMIWIVFVVGAVALALAICAVIFKSCTACLAAMFSCCQVLFQSGYSGGYSPV